MQNINQAKKENAQSFFARGKLNPGIEDVALSQDRVFQKVSKHYLNYQSNSMKNKMNWLRKRPAIVFATFAVFALLIAVPVLLLSSNGTSTPTDTKIKSEIAYTEGKVEYKTQDGVWQEASKDTLIEEGASIRTDADAKAIINLDDGSSIRLNANSAVSLTSLNPEDILISNDKGEIYTRVAKMDRDFQIKSGDITYKSLGTAYKTVNTETKQGVEVYHSQVNILGVNGSDEILVEQGNRYYIVNTEATDLEGKLSEISLDEINQDEFLLWNKEQDEMINEFKSQMGILFDLIPPTLEVTAPTDGTSTQADKVTVTGTTEAGATVTVNDQAVENVDGSFSYEIALNIGANGIKVVSRDEAGNSTIVNLTVTREGTPVVTSTGSISLNGVAVDSGVSLTWNVSNLDVSHGFKIVKSTSANPVYPGSSYAYLSSPSARNYTWSIQDGKTYHFRVCQYDGNGTCLKYSNDITVTAPSKPAETGGESSVSSISLVHNGGKNFSWSVNGYSAKGFKLVWAEGSAPIYPGSAYNYYSNPSTTSGTVDGTSGKTYNVRVCEYLGGACGVYSNMLSFVMP